MSERKFESSNCVVTGAGYEIIVKLGPSLADAQLMGHKLRDMLNADPPPETGAMWPAEGTLGALLRDVPVGSRLKLKLDGMTLDCIVGKHGDTDNRIEIHPPGTPGATWTPTVVTQTHRAPPFTVRCADDEAGPA